MYVVLFCIMILYFVRNKTAQSNRYSFIQYEFRGTFHFDAMDQ